MEGKYNKGKGTLLSQVEVAIVNAQVEKSSTIGLKTCCNKFIHLNCAPLLLKLRCMHR